jgi:N12 class adenine-specific DNA methylase
VGIGSGEVHPAAAGDEDLGPRNTRNYRITDADKLGAGTPKQKFRGNVAAIRALRAVQAESRDPSDAERAVMVKYVGWGGLPQVFATPEDSPQWTKEQEELASLLEPDELASARATVLNAHYTSPTVIRAVYAGLARFGFTGGRILEPSCGLGHFIGVMPADMAARSEVTAIEIDPLTARMAKALYPDVDVLSQAFENATLPTNRFDLAISNIPFGDYAPFDPKLNPRKFHIHDYFFVAAAERVRPGGLIAFITSRYTLDKQYPQVRDSIAKSCDLVGAIRLPNTAFKQNAGTEVTTDILFLRKRGPGQKPGGPDWRVSKPTGTDENPIFLNEYYHAHPEMMLGKLERVAHGMYGREEVRLSDDGRDLAKALELAVGSLPSAIYKPLTHAETAMLRQTIPVPPGVKPNAYVLTDQGGGGIAVRDGEELRLLVDLPPMTARRIRRLIYVRDAARDCLRTQVENKPEEQVDTARFRLNQDYDYFVGQFGPISASANVRAFAGDPDLPLLLSLENYDEDSGLATKTAIFRERTIQRRQPILGAGTAQEALVITLSEKGRVDLDHIAKLLGKQPAEFLPEFRGALFLNPETKRWETDDDYLAGNVRQKLAIAEAAAAKDSSFQANVAALQSVQPDDLKATEIDVRLGAAWLPPDDIAAFGHELLHGQRPGDLKVHHAAHLGLWTVEASFSVKNNVANTSEWGTKRISGHALLEDALNLRTPTIFDYVGPDRKPVLNAIATEAAREKQQKIKDRFIEWIWTDDSRRARLVAFYNREFNHLRLRAFNGDHLTLPGASPSISLRPHQKAGVWRILQDPNVLLAHVVGAGKTYTMAAAAMELKRLGLARKPMFVVPNHMLGQFSSELLALYPNANVLAASRDDFSSHRRRELMSRIATNNWDAIIVTHSGFERLPLSATARKDFLTEQLAELVSCILDHKNRIGASASGTRIVKELERAKKKLEGRIKSLSAEHRKDDTLTFEELGVDRLFVDEAQAFKNLFYISKMTRVAGLPQAASERAFDMFLKVQHIQRQNNGGGVVFATGTPITNTMAEMFTMQRYLQMEELKKHHLEHFDAWAGTFGETVTAMELAPDGAGYRLHTRFARFVNVPELMQMFRRMADVQTADMLKLPVPALEGGKATIIRAPATPELKAFVASLAKRAEKLKTDKVDPSVDNMLKITGEGRKAALDLRLMLPATADFEGSKVNLAVREIHDVWKKSQEKKLTQLVFCDLSTPGVEGGPFSVYRDLRAKLMRFGVPGSEIAFIHDYDSDAEKLTLFKDVRAGKMRILLGSTQKMGAGTNVQRLLYAEHHLDPPWRPADVEQRDGRILRQGNSNPSVRIYRYVTEGSFDAYMWQTLETKAKFIGQVMTGQTTARRIEDLDTPALTYAEVKAIASGNPLVIEKAKVDAEVMRLSRLRSEHAESQYGSRSRVRMMEEDVQRLRQHVAAMEQDLKIRHDTQGDKFRMVLEGKTYTERAAAGNALVYLVADHKDDHLVGRPAVAQLGELAGFKLEYRSTLPDKITLRGTSEYVANVSASPAGSISSLEHVARCIEDQLLRTQANLTRTQAEIGQLGGLSGKAFEHEERYRDLLKRQGELVDLLDITKNQASAQQATETKDVADSVSGEVPEPGEAEGESSEEGEGEAPAKPAVVRPELLSPSEAYSTAEFSVSGADSYATFPGGERWLNPGSRSKVLAIRSAHKGEIRRAFAEGRPVNAAAVAAYHLKPPVAYTRAGERLECGAPPVPENVVPIGPPRMRLSA